MKFKSKMILISLLSLLVVFLIIVLIFNRSNSKDKNWKNTHLDYKSITAYNSNLKNASLSVNLEKLDLYNEVTVIVQHQKNNSNKWESTNISANLGEKENIEFIAYYSERYIEKDVWWSNNNEGKIEEYTYNDTKIRYINYSADSSFSKYKYAYRVQFKYNDVFYNLQLLSMDREDILEYYILMLFGN